MRLRWIEEVALGSEPDDMKAHDDHKDGLSDNGWIAARL